MADTKIKFTAEGIETLRNAMSSVLDDVRNFGKEWVGQNEQLLDMLKDQISQLQKRNEVAKQFNLGAGGSQGAGGFSGQGQSDSSIKDELSDMIDAVTKFASEGISLSQETLDAIVDAIEKAQSSTGNNRQDGERDGDEKSSNRKKTDAETLTRFLTAFAAANVVRAVNQEDPVKAVGGLIQNTMSALASSGNMVLSLIGTVGSALTGKQMAKYDVISETMDPAVESKRLTGMSIGEGVTQSYGLNFGLRKKDYLERRNEWSRSAQRALSRDEMDQMLAWETTTDLSRGEINSLMKSLRGTGRTASRSLNAFRDRMTSVGGYSDEDFNLNIRELTSSLTSLNDSQRATVGQSNDRLNQVLMSSLTGTSQLFKNSPELLSSTINNLYSGLKNAPSRQAEAFQMRALQRVDPSMSYWDMMKLRSNTGDKRYGEYLSNYLDELKAEAGGDDERYEQNIAAAFNLDPHIAEQIRKGELSKEDMQKKIQEASPEGLKKKEEERMNSISDNVSEIRKGIAAWEQAKVGGDWAEIMGFIRFVNATLLAEKTAKDVAQAVVENSSVKIEKNEDGSIKKVENPFSHWGGVGGPH